MARIIILMAAIVIGMTTNAKTYSYRFNSTSLPIALQKLTEDHPEVDINFIYNELENYRTNSTVESDNVYEALLQLVGLNPVTVTRSRDTYYIEALQHGKYLYTGRVASNDGEPVAGATVMLLAPKDSTVMTYGITDEAGRFSIPCDRSGVLAKLSCVGYKTTYKDFHSFSMGTVVIPELPIRLNTVTVEGANNTLLSDRSIYRPTQRQKNASQNAIDLLRQMAIPQIQINPISESITDNGGIAVAIFINYLPASSEELEGMRTMDVKRVEYLEFPIDPRFRGAQRAINIIVQEYEYGGYTKLTTNENIMIGFSSRNNIFSKFSFRKITYDLYVGANNWNNHHIGKSVEGIYTLKDTEGEDYNLTRSETPDRSHYKQNQYPVTLRATYTSEKIQIRNTLGLIHSGIPVNEQQGNLMNHPALENNYSFDRSNPSRKNTLVYQGSFFLSMPKKFSLDVAPRLNYTHSNDKLSYATSNSPAIIRNARENAYNYRVDANLQKRIGKKHTAMLGINGGDIVNRLRYSGTNSYYDRFHIAFAAGMVRYNYQTRKISLYADAGVCWEGSDINGEKHNDTYPFTHINLRYSPNSRNAFSAYFQYATNSPGVDQKASDILQENEYMYITGNPQLHNSRHITLNTAYTWMPSNTLGISVFSNFMEYIDRQIIIYEPYNNGQALIRNYRNNGNYIKEEIGLAANWKLLGGKVQLYSSPKQIFYKSTGIYDRSYNPFFVNVQATYYLKSFYFQAYYRTADREMFADSPQTYRSRNFHSVTAGWANSSWNIRIMASNVFNKGWSSAYIVTESPLYTEYRENIGTTSHPRINVTVTYTFGYGKKVQRGNEVGEQSGASSAIMK